VAFEPTPDQQKVINHDPGRNGRVLAGPGTGKSSTAVALAEQLARLEPPPTVKFITFTRAATAELAKKVQEAGQEATMPSTMHSFAISVLLRNEGAAPIPQPLRLADDWEQRQLIRRHLAEILGIGVADVDRLLREMAARWQSLDPELKDEKVDEKIRDKFVGIFGLHRRTFGYTLLSELPELLRGVLETYGDVEGVGHDLMLVDEYQDLNACDLEVLRLLSVRGSRILAVGDDDQSIYSFRKAHPEGIRRFLEDYPGAEPYTLTHCHRLNEVIGRWAQFVIGGDPAREPRDPPTYGPDAPEGLVKLLGFPGTKSEAEGVAKIVSWLIHNQGLQPSDIAVLFRGDYQGRFSKPIQEKLEAAEVAVVDFEKAQRLMAEPGTRRMLAILQLVVNPTDSLAWWSLMHNQDGIGEVALNHFFGLAQERGTTFGEVLTSDAPDFKNLSTLPAARMAKLYRETTGMIDAVAAAVPQRSRAWGALVAGLVTDGGLPQCGEELLAAITATDEAPDDDAEDDGTGVTFREFVSRFGLRLREQVEADQSGVRLMSMAQSKGLTVRASIVVAVEDDVIPWPGADFNEERRLLYVAMTRAKEHLFLTWVERRQGPAARSGHANVGKRRPSDLLWNGPVKPESGPDFVSGL
jgi:DNA helicase II / ATP-dependent DNA helicase PcrA